MLCKNVLTTQGPPAIVKYFNSNGCIKVTFLKYKDDNVIKAKLKKSDGQTNIDNYRLSALKILQ